jgi:hypothetical protein
LHAIFVLNRVAGHEDWGAVVAVFYAVGNALVTHEELTEMRATGAFDAFEKKLATNPSEARIPFTTGELNAENRKTEFQSDGKRTPFKPIGPNKPLTIEIRHVALST